MWLQRFGTRLLESDELNNKLAQRMVQLGELGCGDSLHHRDAREGINAFLEKRRPDYR